jgi:hypothetical protein
MMPCLQDFKCTLAKSIRTPDGFRLFLSCLPSLTRLDLDLDFRVGRREGWGPALASSCPHLTSLRMCLSFPHRTILASDLEALLPLSLTSLMLYSNVDVSALQVIGRISTLRSLILEQCDAVFQLEGARALSNLTSLTLLDVKPREPHKESAHAISLLLASLGMLQDFSIPIEALTERLARSLALHPSLSRLHFHEECTLSEANLDYDNLSTAFSLIYSSKFISSLTLEHSYLMERFLRLDNLQGAVHLLETNLFELCVDVNDANRELLKYQHEARNRRLLHNWCCICVLLASYRANRASVIRDSMLSLVSEVMDFLVPEDWEVVRH